jgi:D-cysteine desulfhydrase
LANRPHDEGPILSAGGVASHHLLALALFLAQQQRKLHALTFEQTMTEHAWRNLAVLLSAGAQLWHVRTRTRLPWAWLAYSTWHRPAERGTALQVGASTPLGCLGFIEAALELAQQIEQGELPRPDVVFVTAGTAGTCVGLALGFALARMATHIHIVSSVERWAFNRWLLAHKFGEVWRGLRAWGCKTTARHPKQLLAEAGITFALDHSQVGPGYGVPTASTERAITMAAAHGLGLEPTYTGKCVAGLQAALERGSLAGDVLFWHTHAGNDLRPMIRPGWHARLPAALRDRDIPRL